MVLGRLLNNITERNREAFRPGDPDFDEVVEDLLVIERVAPRRIWFLDGIGPIKVPEAASVVARGRLPSDARPTSWKPSISCCN